jgi:beta-lactamase regulating signal transducer with metallopeptidase domain
MSSTVHAIEHQFETVVSVVDPDHRTAPGTAMTAMVWIALAIVGLATSAAVVKELLERKMPPPMHRPDDPT